MQSPRSYVAAATVGDGIEIHLRSLTPSQFALAAKLGDEDRADDEGLRHSVVSIAGQPVTPADLRGKAAVDRLLPGRAYFQAMRAFKQLHEPRASHVDNILHYLEVEDTAEGLRYTLGLPETRLGFEEDYRRIVMVPRDRATVRQAVAQAKQAARSGQARQIYATIHALCSSIVQVEDQTWAPGGFTPEALDEHFTATDMLLLGAVWAEIQTGAVSDGPEGNLRAVPTPS